MVEALTMDDRSFEFNTLLPYISEDVGLEPFEHGLFHVSVDQHVVGGDADLPIVQAFPPSNATAGVFDVNAGIHDDRAFPPSSKVTEVKLFAAAAMTFLPMAVPPVKQMCWKGMAVKEALTSGPPNTTAATS